MLAIHSRATRLFLTVALAVPGLASCSSDIPAAELGAHPATGAAPALEDTPLARELAEVRRATERFRDVKVALAEGYLPDPANMCITAPMEGMPRQLGAMGIHYFRPDLLGITAVEPRVDGVGTHTDFTRPAVLIYEPQSDGSLELVAVENLVFEKAWRPAGNTEPPSFHGHDYYHMIDNPLTEVDKAHGFEPHYELHLWLYRENPQGMFFPFNPGATCEQHAGQHAHP